MKTLKKISLKNVSDTLSDDELKRLVGAATYCFTCATQTCGDPNGPCSGDSWGICTDCTFESLAAKCTYGFTMWPKDGTCRF